MSQKSVLFILLFAVCGSQSLSVHNVNSWHVKLNSVYANTTATNGIYTVAAQLGMIPDNLYFQNVDSESRWLAYENWTVNHTFLANDLLNYDHINLVIDGIDDNSNITLNGIQIGITSNMFRRYVFDVAPYLRPGCNRLQILLSSPIDAANRLHSQRSYPIPPECPQSENNGNCYVNLLRKMQMSFGWDLGPSVPSMGIWKPIHFEAFDDTIIRDLVTDVQSFNETFWILNVDVYFAEHPTNGKRIIGTLYAKLDQTFDKVEAVNIIANSHGEYVFTTSYYVDKRRVNSWWPNGYGEQALYNFQIYFISSGYQHSFIRNRIGFRSVELVQEKIGSSGLSFYFKVNGVPIFMKGSNWMPIDLRPELGQDRAKIEKLLGAAKWANMNMLRIWGGGVYESDVFYELADELGILLWQDFMFVTSLYPSDASYLDSVKQEVRHQVKRIHSHPSVIVWCGNDNNEAALMDNWWKVNDKQRYIEDYIKLYITTIKAEFDRLTHNRGIFVSSSPSNGLKTEQDGWLSSDSGSDYYGDVHYFNYDHNPFDPDFYPIPRFCSAFGYQSLPSSDSFLQDTVNLHDLAIDSSFMNYRQHHPNANTQILDLIKPQLQLPTPNTDRYIEAILYYSQIIQAYAHKSETEHYRSYRSILRPDGRGQTMAALHFHLNDVWTAPTWSSIDFYGRWKMSQYLARHFFKDVIVTALIGNWAGPITTLTIYSITDTKTLSPGNLIIQFVLWDGTVHATEQIDTAAQAAGSSKQLYQFPDINVYIHSKGITPSDIYINLILTSGGEIVAENYFLPTTLIGAYLKQPTLTITSVTRQNARTYTLTVSCTGGVAVFVWLDSHRILGHFSDNGFLLPPGTKTVTFYSDNDTSEAYLRSIITVIHVRDKKFFP